MQNDDDYKFSLKLYREKLEPKIKELDIFLKSKDTYSVKETAKILELEEKEVLSLKENLGIKEITTKNFIELMKNGSSFICKILKKELDCGSPLLYTPENIAYIYNLEYNEVKNAFEFLSLEKVTSNQISLILAQIT